MRRAEALAALRGADEPWDLLVVGGGIAGAGVALEAARAGVRVALVEARDYAAGTSSRSSKLVHGGLRYLAQGQLGLTRESVQERDALLAEAPGLVRPLRFLLPVRAGDRKGRHTLGLGLALYDLLAGRRSRAWHGPAALLERAPSLTSGAPARAELLGAWSYEDAQTDDARLVLRLLDEARSLGAITLNHLAVTALRRNAQGEVCGATMQPADRSDGFDLDARCVVNATGVWADGLRHMGGTSPGGPRLRPLRGSHLLLPDWRLPLAQAVAFFHPDDGRPVFALPWEGATLVGTTDLDHRQDLALEPGISRAEFDYLLRALRHEFPTLDLGPADVLSTWSGVRPVLDSGRGLDPSREGREHLVCDEGGLITVTGGKLTTFRRSALQALRLARQHVPALRAAPLREDAPLLVQPACRPADLPGLDAARALRWLSRYGSAACAVHATARPGELARIGRSDCSWAELRWACRAEGVEHLDDLLLRRSRLGLLLPEGARALLPQLRPLLQQELGWDEARWQQEQAQYLARIARCYAIPSGDHQP